MTEPTQPTWPPVDAHAACSTHGYAPAESDDHSAPVAEPAPSGAPVDPVAATGPMSVDEPVVPPAPAPADPVVHTDTDGGPGIPPPKPAD